MVFQHIQKKIRSYWIMASKSSNGIISAPKNRINRSVYGESIKFYRKNIQLLIIYDGKNSMMHINAVLQCVIMWKTWFNLSINFYMHKKPQKPFNSKNMLTLIQWIFRAPFSVFLLFFDFTMDENRAVLWEEQVLLSALLVILYGCN